MEKTIDNERFIHSPRGKVNHFRSVRLSFGNAAEIAKWIFHNILCFRKEEGETQESFAIFLFHPFPPFAIQSFTALPEL